MFDGPTLRYLRRTKGLTQEDLGLLVGVHLLTVHRWEKGLTTPRASHVQKLARVFGVPEVIVLDAVNRSAGRLDARAI